MKGLRECSIGGRPCVALWCQGCKAIHWVPVNGGEKTWQWDSASQTLAPSVRHFHTRPDGTEQTHCHYHVRNGHIDYCNDCPHPFNDKQQVPLDMPPPENYGGKESFGW